MDSKLHLGEVYLFKDEWKISLSCNECGVETDRLEHFLLHSLEHVMAMSLSSGDKVLSLMRKLNEKEKAESDIKQEDVDEEDAELMCDETDPLGELDDNEDAAAADSLNLTEYDETESISNSPPTDTTDTTTEHVGHIEILENAIDLPIAIEHETGFLCSFCKKDFKRKAACKLHIKTHTNERAFKCPICGVAFVDISNFRVHERRHLGIKRFACEHCDRSFITSSELRSHVHVVHLQQARYKCPECDRSFYRASHLRVHIAAHRKERPCVCKHCGKTYPTISELNVHELLHLDEPQFKCSTCGKAFGRRKTLLQHMRLHSDEKKYVCEICGMKFAQYTGRYNHKKKMHPPNNAIEQ